MRTSLLPGLLALLLSASLVAQQALPPSTLVAPKLVPIQNWFEIVVTAPPGSVALFLASATDGSTPTKYGTLAVSFPFLILNPITIPEDGTLDFRSMVLCNRVLPGFTLHMQFISVGPGPGKIGISNPGSMTFVDASNCNEGEHITFMQSAYDGPCQANNASCLLQTAFETVFPNGLLVGAQTGPPGGTQNAALFTSAGALQAFQPQGPSQGPFDAFAVNPTDSVAGHLAGQLAIAKLNVALDDAGLLEPYKIAPNGIKLGDMILVLYVSPLLSGRTVRDVLDLADSAIGHDIAMPADLDGDVIPDLTFAGLDWTLTNFNENYENGTGNNQVLANPFSP